MRQPQLLGSVFVPSKRLLAQMKFRWVIMQVCSSHNVHVCQLISTWLLIQQMWVRPWSVCLIYWREHLINTMATRRQLSGLAHHSTPVMHVSACWAVVCTHSLNK